MSLKPGSFLWLLAHDLRLGWRGLTGMFGHASNRKTVAILLAGAALLHLIAIPVVAWLKPYMADNATTAAPLAAAILGVFTWMIAQSLFSATRTLFDRADLDLLLSSPLPPARIIAAKAISIMLSTLGSIALLTLPVAHMGAVMVNSSWLGIYPVLAGLGLVATALGVGIAMGLFFLVGPRRARLYAQLTGAGLGGAFVLGAQIVAMLPETTRTAVGSWINRLGLSPTAGSHALAWLPVNAIRGEPAAMMTILGCGAVCFAVTMLLLGERFAIAAVAAAGAPSSGALGKANATIRFRGGIGACLRLKEWRLLVRDPSLFAQLGLQIIYTIPIAVVLLRSQMVPTAFALVPTIVVIAAQVTGSIAWLTVSGEDAPELIATAPVTSSAVDRAKLSAVVAPVLAILALPIAGLALIALRPALIAIVFAAGVCTASALLNFWHPMPGNRRGMLRRHQQSKLIGLIEHGLAMLFAFAVVFALVGSVLTLIPIGIAVGILAFVWRGNRRRAGGGLSLRGTQTWKSAFKQRRPA